MSGDAPLWVDAIVSLLLVNGAAFCVVGAAGLLRFPHFFLRAHPAALPYTMGTWSIALASLVWFSASQENISIQSWTIVVLLPIGAPVAVALLARAALFRLRRAGYVEPPPRRSTDAPARGRTHAGKSPPD